MFTLCLVCGMEEIRDTNEERGKKEEIQSVRLKVEEEEEQANSISTMQTSSVATQHLQRK